MQTRKEMLRGELDELRTYPWWRRMGWSDYGDRVRYILLQLWEIEQKENEKVKILEEEHAWLMEALKAAKTNYAKTYTSEYLRGFENAAGWVLHHAKMEKSAVENDL